MTLPWTRGHTISRGPDKGVSGAQQRCLYLVRHYVLCDIIVTLLDEGQVRVYTL